MDEMMFCYQCEQAANCTACTGKAGVCGKSAETADAQDKLTGALIGFATLLLDIGRPIQPPQALLLTEGLFTTITNVDFDPQTVAQLTDKVWKAKQEAFTSASLHLHQCRTTICRSCGRSRTPTGRACAPLSSLGCAAWRLTPTTRGCWAIPMARSTCFSARRCGPSHRSGTRTSSSSWWRTPADGLPGHG